RRHLQRRQGPARPGQRRQPRLPALPLHGHQRHQHGGVAVSAHPFAREPKRLIAQREAARHGVLDEAVVLTRAECEDVVQRALRASKADACRVSVNSTYDTNVRFADNQMSTSGITDNASLSITSFVGKRSATVLTNDLSQRGLEQAVAQSEALARLAPEDPESLPELGQQRYVEIPA